MNTTIDFKIAKTIENMSRKIDGMVVSILRRSNISMITTCGSVLPCSISANLRRGWRAAMPLWNRNL